MTKKEAQKVIESKYKELCETPSDINQLLPFLRQAAEWGCEHITEMGVRTVVSTWAFLAAQPKKMICYDISRYPNMDYCEKVAKAAGVDFTFHESDVLKVEIEPTDLLFIDTFHSAAQLERELSLHASKVRHMIAFHDTTTFWENAEPSYESAAKNGVNGTLGLKYAIEPFLEQNPEWEQVFRTEINNGLTIIQRMK